MAAVWAVCMVEHLTLAFEIQIGENKDKQAKKKEEKVLRLAPQLSQSKFYSEERF